MGDTTRIDELLAAMLENGRSPEEVCADHPELLPEVRARWVQLQQVSLQVETLFPTTPSETHDQRIGPRPHVPGYDIQAILGRGGMGIVYQAKHLRLNRSVAIKMLLAGAYALRSERLRFVREAEAVAALQHPNIVQIYEIGEAQSLPFFTMELVTGGTLAQRIATQPLSPRAAAEFIATVAEAMQTAHERAIIHRDLKPANILLTDVGMPKITDFGLARRLDATVFTVDGQALGTPSYMAPEQVRGQSHHLGPAVDIYACGAILYELLTGRPPFQSATNLATTQLVLTEEVVAPSRMVPRVPRDLETICLHCLHKEPSRRYESATALAADLRRFLAGQPVHARPLGTLARSIKWARRRPTVALLSTTLVVLSIITIAVGVWWQHKENERQQAQQQRTTQARRTLETALQRADDFCREERWPEALLVLNEAAEHLNHVQATDLAERLRQAQQDCQTALALEDARMSTPLLDTGMVDYAAKAREYETVFGQLGASLSSVPTMQQQLRDSAIRKQLVAACDEWAYAAHRNHDDASCEQLLRFAREADPDPSWRDRLRDSTSWNQGEQLRTLATTAFTTTPEPSEHLIAMLNLLLRHNNGGPQGTQLLARACQQRPGSYWLNREMGNAFYSQGRHLEAIGYYRAALAVRPDSALTHQSLGLALFQNGQIETALTEYRQAVALAPQNRSLRGHFVEKLAEAGYWKDAANACAHALRDDPTNYSVPLQLARCYSNAERVDEAVPYFHQAIAADADAFATYHTLGMIYVGLGREAEALPYLQRLTELQPQSGHAAQMYAHSLARTQRIPEAERAYWRAIQYAPTTLWYSQELGELLRQQGRKDEAAKVLRQVIERGHTQMRVWDQYAAVLLDQGDFAAAATATKKAIENHTSAEALAEQQRRLALCNRLHTEHDHIAAYLAGTEQPRATATQLALAEWCLHHQHRPYRAVELYERAFTGDQALAATNANGQRFQALCATGQALAGTGADTHTLTDERRAAMRKQAFAWLTAEYEEWHTNHRTTPREARAKIVAHVRGWLQHGALESLRGTPWNLSLPFEERRQWQELWTKISTLANRDPDRLFARGRELNGRGQWAQALTCYREGLAQEPMDYADIWYEYAATQLLSGDVAAYQRTCMQLVERSQREPQLRRYLIARMCTLGPAERVLPTVTALANAELQGNDTTYWSLTQQAALHIRAQAALKAVPLLEQSLQVENRPSRAVVSQLWLALAHRQLGNHDEAKRWLTQAKRWLDQQSCQMHREGSASGTHLHNWLEAQILLRECASLTP